MTSLIRSTAICLASLALAACGNDAAPDSTGADPATANAGSSEGRTAYERDDDHAIGSPDAPVTLVEYASVTCPACVVWHRTVYPTLKSDYIDTGKVRYVFREFPASNPQLAEVGFMIALCAPEENYFTNIGLQFERFEQINQMARNGQAREAYVNIAQSAGLSEEEFVACVTDPDNRDHIMDKMQSGIDLGVRGTPSFFVNGADAKVDTVEQMEETLSALLGETAE